ncbi:MAG TPA: murein biosynthesis integral membrane protein MurJ, partial [Spirochaetia bacterium]|nr:murein biosynthesis integral membrane protein MurJ [Spirochaetia bacterium]
MDIDDDVQLNTAKSNTRSTLIVMVCTFVSRLLGFVRTAVTTAIYGASGTADVINLTFAVPNNLRKLLAEGALSSAFIPVLSETLVTEKDPSIARKLVRNIISFQLLILVPLCILSILWARPLIVFVLTQFTDPEQIDLSVALFRWFINYLILISVSAAMMGILNSHGKFFLPAFTPILFSVSVIGFILGFRQELGVYAMAVGVIVGGIAQIAFQYPLYRKLGYDFLPSFSFNTERFKRIIKQWLPLVATSSIFIITEQVSFRFASGLEEGSASAISNALVFWQLPFGIFSASITTVLFPQMSRQAALKDTDGLRNSIQYGLNFLLVLLVPSAVVLSFFGKEIISVAYQRGMFTM